MNVQEQFAAEMETMGPETVRLKVQSRLLGDWQYGAAIAWLAQKDADAARQAEARRTQEALTAKEANRRLKTVNTIMIVVSGLTLMISLLAWLFPRR